MIFIRALIAVGLVVLGFFAYPYYVSGILTPLTALAHVWIPDMDIYASTAFAILPFASFLGIIFLGFMVLLGKITVGGDGNE